MPSSSKGPSAPRWFRTVTIPVPTLRTWILLTGVGVTIGCSVGARAHDFLAITRPAPGAAALLIEAGPSPDLVRHLRSLIKSGRYRRFIPVGMPLDPLSDLASFGTDADVWKVHLAQLGVPGEQIELVRLPALTRYRTAHKALAIGRHLLDHPAPAVDLLSPSTHARRSHLIYREALAPIQVGILAAPQPYEMEHWWRSSAGVRAVLGEWIALGYVLLRGDEVTRAQEQWGTLSAAEREVRVPAHSSRCSPTPAAGTDPPN